MIKSVVVAAALMVAASAVPVVILRCYTDHEAIFKDRAIRKKSSKNKKRNASGHYISAKQNNQ